jgi:hypothetical protein
MKIETKQNFISVDGKTAMSSYGDFFTIGETVKHQDLEAGIATIISFKPDIEKNEVVVNTDKGYAHLDFLVKIDVDSKLAAAAPELLRACIWAKEQFKRLADEGNYPEFMLGQNGGEGIMPLVRAINSAVK